MDVTRKKITSSKKEWLKEYYGIEIKHTEENFPMQYSLSNNSVQKKNGKSG